MKTAEEAQRGGGPRRWQCSKERCSAPTCPTSQGRIGGEEGHSQSRVDGLGAALTGGGDRRHGLDEIWRGGRVPDPGTGSTSSLECRGVLGFFCGVLKLEEWGRKKRRGDGSDRRSLKAVAAEESGVGVRSACGQVEEERGATVHARAGGPRHERRAVGRR
jgi:hypothetical protein